VEYARWFRRTLALILLAECFGGCGTIPNASAIIHDRQMYQQRPTVVGDKGPLPKSRSEAVINRLQARAGDTDILQRQLVFEQAISGSPLVLGNRVTLLENGAAAYRAMFAAIEGAEHNINLETYIFDGDKIGDEFADALIAKQRQGVQVNIIYDGFGSVLTRRSFFERMRASGIRLVEFDPINPFAAGFHWAPLHRDHRKLMVVDGEVAITGGINISGVYSGSDIMHRRYRSDDLAKSWRDTDVEIEGPAVAQFQGFFIANWLEQGGEPLTSAEYFPPQEEAGHMIVRVLGSEPRQFSTIYVTLMSAIRNAQTNIYITDAYFAPGAQTVEALEAAARRGVDVRLLLPGRNNEPLIGAAGRDAAREDGDDRRRVVHGRFGEPRLVEHRPQRRDQRGDPEHAFRRTNERDLHERPQEFRTDRGGRLAASIRARANRRSDHRAHGAAVVDSTRQKIPIEIQCATLKEILVPASLFAPQS